MKSLLTVIILIAGVSSFAVASEKPAFTPTSEMPAGVYKSDVNHTNVYWRFNHLGLSNPLVKFNNVVATLDFDPKDPLKSRVTVMIDPKSVESTSQVFNEHMVDQENWFDAKKYPEIKFVSTKVEKTGENKGILHGDLTIKGVTKPVKLEAMFNGAYKVGMVSKLPTLGFSAKTTLKRSDFNIGAFIPAVPDDIDVLIDIEFLQSGEYK